MCVRLWGRERERETVCVCVCMEACGLRTEWKCPICACCCWLQGVCDVFDHFDTTPFLAAAHHPRVKIIETLLCENLLIVLALSGGQRLSGVACAFQRDTLEFHVYLNTRVGEVCTIQQRDRAPWPCCSHSTRGVRGS